MCLLKNMHLLTRLNGNINVANMHELLTVLKLTYSEKI